MPVPSKMADLFTIAASNSPAGSDLIGNSLDDYLRAGFAILRSTNALASASIAAASTADLSTADGESVQITGSATINSLGTAVPGLIRECRFVASCVLANSSAIVLPGSANITTNAGDVLTFRSLGSGNWIMVEASNVYGYLPLTGGTLTGPLTVQGAVTSSQNFVSSTTSAVLAATGSGAVVLRPNGAAVTTGQMIVDTNGNGSFAGTLSSGGAFTASGAVSSSQNFVSTTTSAVLAATGTGSVVLRPNGAAVTTGQMVLDNGGNASVQGTFSSVGTNTAAGFSAFAGSVGTQQLLGNWGWNNSVPRWKPALETDASFSFYSYNSSGVGIAQAMNITQAGVVKAADFQTTSDLTLKRDVKPLSRGLEALRKMAPIEYEIGGQKQVGFGAQTVRGVVPEAVSEGQDGYLRVSYGQLLALVAKAVLDIDKRLSEASI